MSIHCSCIICHKEFSYKGIHTHFERAHGTDDEKLKYHTGFDLIQQQKRFSIKKQITTEKHTRNCKHCLKQYSHRSNVFCSQSCSASYNNTNRTVNRKPKPPTIKQIAKSTRIRLRTTKQIMVQSFNQPCGPFTLLYYKNCAHCNILFVNDKKRKYCTKCVEKYTNNRMDYRFQFNVYHYPDLFDIQLLTELGWYAPKGKSGKWNPNGLCRDHKVSVNEAIKNNYDPYYISHVMNCELITQVENNKKKTSSSLSYPELVALVNSYDNMVALATTRTCNVP